MKRLYDLFWELMDEQADRYGQRAVAGLFGLFMVWIGLMVVVFLVWLSDKIPWLKNLQ